MTRQLTHGRTQTSDYNGNSGPIRRFNMTLNKCPSVGIAKSGCGAGDAERRNALVGGIGTSVNGSVRAAIKRRVKSGLGGGCVFPLN